VTILKSLIVEDDPVSARILKDMISRYGTLEVAVNGNEAMDLFYKAHESGSPFDLILMDIMMPDVDGLTAVSKIREKELQMKVPVARQVKIIMITALSDPRTVIKALYESGACSYLVKPISLAKLVEELKALKLIP
jgi:two-component system chemotaxis response regulator CheY